MPLPKPPAKRAALLSAADFESQAAPATRQAPAEDPRCQPSPPRRPCWSCTTRRRRASAGASAKAPLVTPAGRRSAAHAAARTRARKPRGTGPAKLFVLDTNVLMHDPMCLFRFEEHDIFLPMIMLEELDGHKKGMTEVARNARQVSRDLDALAASMPTRDAAGMSEGLPLSAHRPPRGRRQAVLPDQPDQRHPAGRPAAGQGRQPDPRRGAGAARAATRSARWCWCPRTSTCASRRVRWACRPRTT